MVTVKDKTGFAFAAYFFLSVALETRTIAGEQACAAAALVALEEEAPAEPEALEEAVPLPVAEALAEPDAEADAEVEADADAEADVLGTGEEALGEGDGAAEDGGVVLEDSAADFEGNKALKAALIPQIMSTIASTAAISATQRRRA
ncbi:hypothetical protein GCM10027027_22660 [Neomicrococcus lactis]